MPPEPEPEGARDVQNDQDQQVHGEPQDHGESQDHRRPWEAGEAEPSSALFPGDIPQDDLDAYVGMQRREAERKASARGWRPVRSLPPDAVVTMEYVAGRLNFTVDADHVTRCWAG